MAAKISRVLKAKKSLEAFGRRKSIEARSKKIAQGLGLHASKTSFVLDDFGRTPQYYARIHAALSKFIGPVKGKSILHIASSKGVYTRFLQEKGAKAVALDLNPKASKFAKKLRNKGVVNADAQHLPFVDSSFDAFVSDRFLFSGYLAFDKYHRQERKSVLVSRQPSISALNELHRVLRTGGIGILNAGRWVKAAGYLDETVVLEIQNSGFEILQKNRGFQVGELKNIEDFNYILVLRKK